MVISQLGAGFSFRTMQTIPNTFLYFAYGSNLLKKRIHINNPSAEFIGIGKLDGHQLDFIKLSPNWGGCSGTIVPTEGAYVWGAVWRVHDDNMPALDKQEGVDDNWYFAKKVDVTLPEGTTVECRTYQQTINPPVRKDSEEVPRDRLPSKTYMEVIIKGAVECHLPEEYIQKLKKIPHNGKLACPALMEKLKENMMKSEVRKPGTFLYFAYGANIWGFRIHMHSPSAEFVSIARADNYRLDFHRYNKFWGGPEATMVPTANAHAWGVIWRISMDELVSLDDMKGVNFKKFYVRYIDVLTPYMGYFTCRAYLQRIQPLPMGDNDPVPVERWPSWTYREVMVEGAKEHDFPPFYTEFLKNLKNNSEEGCLRVHCLCIRYGRDMPCKCWVPGRIPRQPLKMDWRQIKVLRDMIKQIEIDRQTEIEKQKEIDKQMKEKAAAEAKEKAEAEEKDKQKLKDAGKSETKTEY